MEQDPCDNRSATRAPNSGYIDNYLWKMAMAQSSGGVRVRLARRADAPAIARLGAALARHVEDPDPGLTADQVVAQGFGPRRRCRYLVATLAGKVVGVAVLGQWFDLHMARPVLYLSDCVVEPETRGHGVGHALMAAAAATAVDEGSAMLRWEVWTGNASALAFYDGLGGRKVEEGVVTMAIEGEDLRRLAGRA